MPAARVAEGERMDQWSPGVTDVGTVRTPSARPRDQVLHASRSIEEREPLPVAGWLVVPTMVLLAAAAIFAGYHWLQFIPDGSLRPSGIVVTVLALVATFALTRRTSAGRAVLLRRIARTSAAALPVLALVGLITHRTAWNQVLGAVSLLLAAALLALAAVSEHADHPRG